MKPVRDILEERISAAMLQVSGERVPAVVTPAKDPKFGDYQANGVMALAKQLKTNPRELAQKVVDKLMPGEQKVFDFDKEEQIGVRLDISDICEQLKVAGPGFINLRLKKDFVADTVLQIYRHCVEEIFPGNISRPLPRFDIDKATNPKTIVVDFSGPNIAKEMHVGHLRSTIIGECICNMLEFLGHTVIPQNHIGDWGTQFGMLCALYEQMRDQAIQKGKKTFPYLPIQDLDAFYKEANNLFNKDEKFASKARDAIAGLHKGNQIWISCWNEIIRASEQHFEDIYKKLGAVRAEANIRGESFYKNMLAEVVEELKKKGLAVESEGAMCVFPEGFKDKDGKPSPLIVQKSDGAYLYATTDLAAIRYRVNKLKADKIVYVTDARQALHFEMVFAVAKKAGWAKDTELVHVTFGSVLGENGKPLKTREGENVKLKDLLDEAVERARAVVEEKNPELSEEKKEKIANAVGIGAVKYADYSNNRTSDYVFSFDKMLAMDGNTAPYMQYAYARIKSIERKAQSREVDIETELAGVAKLNLTEPAELDLAKHLLRYGEVIESTAADYRPNYLTAYLYELAQKFSGFYTECPVLKAETDKRPTRLLLCDLTAQTIRHGLSELLGIEVVEQM
jgi:arginyl-tRNA synthetase